MTYTHVYMYIYTYIASCSVDYTFVFQIKIDVTEQWLLQFFMKLRPMVFELFDVYERTD